MLLIFFAAIPGGILTFSCFVCSVCSRFIHTGDDGHMRLKCCGKYVTGIGMYSMAIWVVDFPGKGYNLEISMSKNQYTVIARLEAKINGLS